MLALCYMVTPGSKLRLSNSKELLSIRGCESTGAQGADSHLIFAVPQKTEESTRQEFAEMEDKEKLLMIVSSLFSLFWT